MIFQLKWWHSSPASSSSKGEGSKAGQAQCLRPCPTPSPTVSDPWSGPNGEPTYVALGHWKDTIRAEEIDSKDGILSACLENNYDVDLVAVTNDEDGTHFFLSASISMGDKTSHSDNKCPKFLAFASRDEKKRVYHVPDITAVDKYRYNSYFFGKASLKRIMDAQSSVKAVKDSKYNLTSNSCVHYALHIWRELHFVETKDLANFLIDNLLKNDGFLTIARKKYDTGGLPVLSYVAGKGSFEDFVKDTVYSQLRIKDDESIIGKMLCHINYIVS